MSLLCNDSVIVSPFTTVIVGLGLVVLFHPGNAPFRAMLRETAFTFGIRIGTSRGLILANGEYADINEVTMRTSEKEATCRWKRGILLDSLLQ